MGICCTKNKERIADGVGPLFNVEIPPIYEEKPPIEADEWICIGCIRESAQQEAIENLRKLIDQHINYENIKEKLKKNPFGRKIYIREVKPRVNQEVVDLWNKDPNNITLERRKFIKKCPDGKPYRYYCLYAILDDKLILSRHRGEGIRAGEMEKDSY